MDIELLVTAEIFRVLLVFCRVGTALMVMPGFGETSFPTQVRLLFALVLSATVYHAVPDLPEEVPDDLTVFVGAILVEIFIGFWIGAIARIFLAALHFLGHQIGYVSALANAMAGGQAAFENSSLFSNLLTMAGIVLIFMADIHHIAIEGVISSYSLIPAGDLPHLSDFAEQGARAVANSLLNGFRFAAPFIVLAIIVNAGMGLANRMMPSLPVYFVATPLLVGGGLALLMVTAGGILLVFADLYADWFLTFRL